MKRLLCILALFSFTMSCKLSQGYKLADVGGAGGMSGCLTTKRAAEEDPRLAEWLRGIAGGADMPELRDAAALTLAAVGTAINSEGDFAKVVEYLGGMDGAAQKLFVQEGRININGQDIRIDTQGVEQRVLERFLGFFNNTNTSMTDKVAFAQMIVETNTRTADAVAATNPKWGSRVIEFGKRIMTGLATPIQRLLGSPQVPEASKRALAARQAAMDISNIEAGIAGGADPASARSEAERLARVALTNLPQGAEGKVAARDIATSVLGVENRLRLRNGNAQNSTGLDRIVIEAMRTDPEGAAQLQLLENGRMATIAAEAGQVNLAREFHSRNVSFIDAAGLGQTPNLRSRIESMRSASNASEFETTTRLMAEGVQAQRARRSEIFHVREHARYKTNRARGTL